MIRATLLSLFMLVPVVGFAQKETPRTATIDFRVGPYQPRIDAAVSGRAPYKEIYGDSSPLMFRLSYDRLLWTKFGSLTMGGSIGYWSNEGAAIEEGSMTPALGESAETSEMMMIPLQLQISYRFDPYQDTIPLVPVFRLGVDYIGWGFYDSAGDIEEFRPGQEAFGGTWGWHWTAGVHLLLDWLSPSMALGFDRDAGVNNSYLTFEYTGSQIDDFGSDESLRLGDNTFFVGLSLDF